MAASTDRDVAVISSGHDVADARLHRIIAALVDRDLTVDLWGLGDAAGAPAGVRVRVADRGSMVARAVRATLWPIRSRATVTVTCDPDTAVVALARRRLSRRRAWVADVHEDYRALLHDRSWLPSAVRPAAQWVAGRLVAATGRADLTVVADAHVPPDAEHSRSRLVLPNLPDYSMLPMAADPTRPLRALHIGDLRRSRGLHDMVEAVLLAPGWSLDLVGPMGSQDQAWLRGRLVQAGATDRVTWHGRQPPATAWSRAGDAQVGLVLLHDTPAFREAMPSKVYEFLGCGLAVVSTPLPRVVDLLERTGGGAIAVDAAAVADLLNRWAADRAELGERQAAARRWAAQARADGNGYADLAERVAVLAGRG